MAETSDTEDTRETGRTGRPTDYRTETVEIILERIADGESLRTICRDDDMPNRATIFRWLSTHEAFRDQYAHAREAQADALMDDMVDIADRALLGEMTKTTPVVVEGEVVGEKVETRTGDNVDRSRLQIETRKWVAGKLKPKKYGDKITQEVTGADGAPLIPVINLTGRPGSPPTS